MEYKIVKSDELYHHGIKGMKWGIRRYQNKDGSLTPAGEKRRAKLEGKLEKLGVKKKPTEESDDVQPVKRKTARDMDDKELQDRVNRLRNEDAYRDLSKKLGYDDGTRTELDTKIADMEKQKRYLELQRDIKNLTPTKVPLGKKIMNSVLNDVVGPAATKAGKDLLTKYLTEAGSQVIGNMGKKEASKINDAVKDATEKVAAKEERKQAKEQAKAEKQQARQESKKTKSDDDVTFTVEGEGTSSKTTNKGKKWTNDSTVIDAEWYEVVTPSNTSSGKSYVSNYLALPASNRASLPASNYLALPAAKDDDD